MNEEKLDKIVEMYNNDAQWFETYYSENEDNVYADYLEWGWAEAGLDIPELIREIDCDRTIERIEQLEKQIGLRETLELVIQHSHKEFSNIYINWNEVYSVSMGEVEEQPSEDLQTEFDSLSQDEKEYVRKNVSDCYVSESGMMYLDFNYNRWVYILDTESFLVDTRDQVA